VKIAAKDLISMGRRIRRLWQSADGNVAVTFGILAIPLIGLAGLALDYTRASAIRAEMQNAADAAALAAAARLPDAAALANAETLFEAETSKLALKAPATIDVTKPSDYRITVAASGEVQTTLLALIGRTMNVGVAATAERAAPSKVVNLKVNKFNSDAYDANTISWYVVPKDEGVPADEDLTPILSNDPKHPIKNPPKQITIGADETIAFALTNVTGGVTPYGTNGYGQPQGSVHKYYSHFEPENVRITGAPDCEQGPVKQAWDDNGGKTDDNDYNDAVFQYECTIQPSAPTNVRLVQ
jgi:Flp pilus assembly protein TadG